MQQLFSVRIMLATGLAVVAAIAVWLLSGDLSSGLVALVGGIAAVLLAIGSGEPPPPAPPPEPAPAIGPDPAEVLDLIVEPVLVIREGQVLLANLAARRLLGQHIQGSDVRLAIRHPAAAERLAAPVGQAPSGAISLVGLGTLEQRWEMRVADTADGQRLVHLLDQTGSYAAERSRVDFVANASHELRTPLASILGFVETLSDERTGDDQEVRTRFLKVMFDEARRMQHLVEDLISLSRIEAEKYRPPDRAVDLADLISEVHSELQDGGDARAADIVCVLDAQVPAVNGDRAQLSQALHNLIGNAMKYGRPGTAVTVRLGHERSLVRLSVADEGEGIAPEHIPRLTERFYRVDAGRSRAMGGTGLGLAIVKHIVERHRGRLDIASRLGQGTLVTVSLPPAALSSNSHPGVTQARTTM